MKDAVLLSFRAGAGLLASPCIKPIPLAWVVSGQPLR